MTDRRDKKPKNTNSFDFLGKKHYLDSIELGAEYIRLCEEDEKAAGILRHNGLYNQAAYMIIQSMEKRVKAYICERMNMGIKVFAEQLRSNGHCLDTSIELLMAVAFSGNDIVKEQLTHQLVSGVFEEQKFQYLNNNLRYPIYEGKRFDYSTLVISDKDVERLSEMNKKLKMFLMDLYMLQR